MGGNALASFGAKRAGVEDYERVCQAFRSAKVDGRVIVVESCRNKESFGDIDVVVADVDANKLIASVCAILGIDAPDVSVKNGGCTSFGLPIWDDGIFQADIIRCDANTLDFTASYFAWGDCGNLMGRIANSMGLTLGHDGLKMKVRDKTNLVAKILLTTDFLVAIEFLGFDADVWSRGFDSQDDVNRFITDNPNFDASVFHLDNRNHIARTRDNKRPGYKAFVEYINANDFKNRGSHSNRADYMVSIFSEFPNALNRYVEVIEGVIDSKTVKSKFNGDIVTAITGLTSKELGVFIAGFKKGFSDFDAFILESDAQTIEVAVYEEFCRQRIPR